jgi:head-tail adaptor
MGNVLPAGELAAMRDELEGSYMPETVEIVRVFVAGDEQGGMVETEQTIGTVAGRIGPLGSQPAEAEYAGRIGAAVGWRVTLPALVDVGARDRLRVAGRTFEVVGVLAPLSWELERHVAAVEVVG